VDLSIKGDAGAPFFVLSRSDFRLKDGAASSKNDRVHQRLRRNALIENSSDLAGKAIYGQIPS